RRGGARAAAREAGTVRGVQPGLRSRHEVRLQHRCGPGRLLDELAAAREVVMHGGVPRVDANRANRHPTDGRRPEKLLRVRCGGAPMQAEETRIDWEAALVVRACSGDSRAFERLYREHVGRVYGLCLRMTRDPHLAEDCTQETFINAWRALSKFETRSALSTWLHRIAV